jgi:hypothetical protein
MVAVGLSLWNFGWLENVNTMSLNASLLDRWEIVLGTKLSQSIRLVGDSLAVPIKLKLWLIQLATSH